MRITGGDSRGRNISSPATGAVRPTGSKVRQALFNIFGDRIENARFLDICAGSGLVGLEALSRGAASLTSVEQDKALARALADAAEKLGYDIKIFTLDFKRALPMLEGQRFDLIFADPPYKGGFNTPILTAICKHKLLKPGGLIAIEHLSSIPVNGNADLFKVKTRGYGQAALSFFAHSDPAD